MLFLFTFCSPKVQESQDSVLVSGIGTVSAQPDMVLMNVSISHAASTTKEAKKTVEQIRAFQNNLAFKEERLSLSDNSTVPTGEQGVSSEVNTVFSLK